MSQPQDKEYGLILAGKNKKPLTNVSVPIKKPSIFDEDSDSDGGEKKPSGISRELKRREILLQDKAVEEDPTIFQYDELYDEMEQKRKDSKLSRKDLDKKPKYINKLLKAAEKRKLENERRIERQVQREREAEGSEFKDKESFVTSAYKKKLEEMKEQEELEKREEYLEAIGDVTKQGNLDGFYRHLYEQKINYDEDKEKKMEEIKTNVDKQTDESTTANDGGETSENQTVQPEEKEKSNKKEEIIGRKRQYRNKRQDSKSEASDDEEEVNTGTVHLQSNLDADSDFSIDSESDNEPDKKISKVDKVENGDDKTTTKEETTETVAANSKDETGKEMNGNAKEEKPKPEETKPKINIWEKRTVGPVLDAALQRYYERKALRESG